MRISGVVIEIGPLAACKRVLHAENEENNSHIIAID